MLTYSNIIKFLKEKPYTVFYQWPDEVAPPMKFCLLITQKRSRC